MVDILAEAEQGNNASHYGRSLPGTTEFPLPVLPGIHPVK
jgi:hypothetical protein